MPHHTPQHMQATNHRQVGTMREKYTAATASIERS